MDYLYIYIVYILLLITAIRVCSANNLLSINIYSGLFSLFAMLQYFILDAPDVAITEASIGAALTTVFTLKALHYLNFSVPIEEQKYSKNKFLNVYLSPMILYSCLCFLLCYAFYKYSFEFEKFGLSEIGRSTFNHYVSYTQNNLKFANVVTAVLAYFRGFDTLLETFVIFTAGIGVYSILPHQTSSASNNETKNQGKLGSSHQISFMFNIATILLPIIIVYALYIQIFGEESPGGGFQAGSIITCAAILYAFIISESFVAKYLSIKTLIRISSLGVFLFLFTGLLSVLLHIKQWDKVNFLDYSYLICGLDFSAECFAKSQKLGITMVELGVGITVFGVTCLIFFCLPNKKTELAISKSHKY